MPFRILERILQVGQVSKEQKLGPHHPLLGDCPHSSPTPPQQTPVIKEAALFKK